MTDEPTDRRYLTQQQYATDANLAARLLTSVVPAGQVGLFALGQAGFIFKTPEGRLLAKVAITTAVSAVIWLAIYALVRSPWLSFREL